MGAPLWRQHFAPDLLHMGVVSRGHTVLEEGEDIHRQNVSVPRLLEMIRGGVVGPEVEICSKDYSYAPLYFTCEGVPLVGTVVEVMNSSPCLLTDWWRWLSTSSVPWSTSKSQPIVIQIEQNHPRRCGFQHKVTKLLLLETSLEVQLEI